MLIHLNIYLVSPSGAADYFPGGPAPKNNLENPRFDPIWYMLTLCAFEPRKTILVQNMSKIFKIILETSGHRKVMFMGGSSLEHICMSNPRKKMPHDYLRGYGSLHDSKRLGTRI